MNKIIMEFVKITWIGLATGAFATLWRYLYRGAEIGAGIAGAVVEILVIAIAVCSPPLYFCGAKRGDCTAMYTVFAIIIAAFTVYILDPTLKMTKKWPKKTR